MFPARLRPQREQRFRILLVRAENSCLQPNTSLQGLCWQYARRIEQPSTKFPKVVLSRSTLAGGIDLLGRFVILPIDV